MSSEWETGICGCCEVKDCGVGCCVKLYCVRPPCASNHQAYRDRMHALQPLHTDSQFSNRPALCLAHGLLCVLPCAQGSPCIWGAAMEKAGHGSCCGCCLALGCCAPCTLCQVRGEMG